MSASLVLKPQRLAIVRGLEVKQGSMKSLTFRLLFLLYKEVVEEKRFIDARLLFGITLDLTRLRNLLIISWYQLWFLRWLLFAFNTIVWGDLVSATSHGRQLLLSHEATSLGLFKLANTSYRLESTRIIVLYRLAKTNSFHRLG